MKKFNEKFKKYESYPDAIYYTLSDLILDDNIKSIKYGISKHQLDFNYIISGKYNILDIACNNNKLNIVEYLISNNICDMDKTYEPIYCYVFVMKNNKYGDYKKLLDILNENDEYNNVLNNIDNISFKKDILKILRNKKIQKLKK